MNRTEDGLGGDVDFEAAAEVAGGDHAGARRRRPDDDRDAARQHAGGRPRAAARRVRPRLAPIVLEDRDCGYCRWTLDKILAWDRRRRMRPVAIQSDSQRPASGASRSPLDSSLVDAKVLGRGSAAASRGPPVGRPLAALWAPFRHVTDRASRWSPIIVALARLLRIDAAAHPSMNPQIPLHSCDPPHTPV